jgi:hypothetical protein
MDEPVDARSPFARIWRRLAVGVALALGCTGDSLSEERFCAEYAELECQTLAGWCGLTEAACQADREAACAARVQVVRSGSHPYDRRAAVACTSALASAYRTQPIPIASLREMEAICDRVYHGHNEVGQGCRSGLDCRDGLICWSGFCAREKLVGANGPCDQPGYRCLPEYHCEFRNQANYCTPSVPVGQSCSSDPCQAHLRCQNMVCANRAPVGTECDRDLDCALPAAYCNPYTGLCADSLSFTPGSYACEAQAGRPVTTDAGRLDQRADASPAIDSAAYDSAEAGPSETGL